MNQHKPASIILSTLHCICMGLLTGTLASIALVLLVMLISGIPAGQG